MKNKNMTSESPVLDRKAAARYLGYAPGTLAVWKSTKRYDLPSIKIGRQIKYRKVDLDKFLEERLTA